MSMKSGDFSAVSQPVDDATVVPCEYFPTCQACSGINQTWASQRTFKIEGFQSLMSFPTQPEFWAVAASGLRDRLDWTLQEGRFGLYTEDPRLGPLDLSICAQLSPRLQDWLVDFRKLLPRLAWIKKASLRLRISPQGVRGLWLDLSHEDTRRLLHEELDLLQELLQQARLEIGQRRKAVVFDGTRGRLQDPVLFPWFETQFQERTIPLWGLIGGFSQPSLAANRLISSWVEAEATSLAPRGIFELGCGNGNLSFPALASGAKLWAFEIDEGALKGFEKSLEILAADGIDLRPQVQLEKKDVIKKKWSPPSDLDMALVNPPRSGLGQSRELLRENPQIKKLIYMSCYPEAFAEDAKALVEMGFQVKRLTLLDQFPQTKHLEVLSSWTHPGRA